MSISLALVYGLAILLPGFFFYGSIFTSDSVRDLQTDSPSPNSILTVFILGFGACVGHIIGIVLVGLNALFAKYVFGLRTPFNPDFYKTLQNLKASETVDLGAALIFLLSLSFITFLAGKLIQKVFPSLFLSVRYGHYSYIMQNSLADEDIVTAFVLCTDTVKLRGSTQEHHFGYEGIVTNIGHDKTGTKFIHLESVSPFVVKKTARGLAKEDYAAGRNGIPFLYIPQNQIKNIALEIFSIDT